jgi:hypothetical protein
MYLDMDVAIESEVADTKGSTAKPDMNVETAVIDWLRA